MAICCMFRLKSDSSLEAVLVVVEAPSFSHMGLLKDKWFIRDRRVVFLVYGWYPGLLIL